MTLAALSTSAAFLVTTAAFAAHDYPISTAERTAVKVVGGFWLPRLETNRLVTLKADFAKCEETPRIANFTNCAARAKGRRFGGIYFDDSDVYKVMEGAAYIYAESKDPELHRYMTWLIGQVAGAQEMDGYLYTARTLGGNRDIEGTGRWEQLFWSHELYNPGHMIEAAVAWYESTGETNFLNVARKNADLLDRTFGWAPDKLKSTSGHQEIELALGRLYRVTGEKRYLDLAEFFLDMRGRKDLRSTWGVSVQDHQPVTEQDEALGHAVRAGYMYCAMADVAALTGNDSYTRAIDWIWEDVVGRKLHLSGGIGAGRHTSHPKWGGAHESFGVDFELPNESAYLETCAAIANALWNVRMFRRDGAAKYMDVVERIIYNGFLSGVSLSGDEFFYMNPLANKDGLGYAKDKPYRRSKWFGTSCCPCNDVRFLPQIPSFAYATDGKDVYVNLFMESEADIGPAHLRVETDYPWSGKVSITVTPGTPGSKFAVKVRIPGWARGRPVPSGLYTYFAPTVLGSDKEYLVQDQVWNGGEKIELDFPMPVRRVRADERVEADRGRLAVERGPIVYCAEGFDNGGKAFDAVLPSGATFSDETVTIGDRTFPALRASNGLLLIPYFAWGHRDPGNEMQVWLRTGDEAR